MTVLAKSTRKTATARPKHLNTQTRSTQVRSSGAEAKTKPRGVAAGRVVQKPAAKRINTLQPGIIRGALKIAEGFYVIESKFDNQFAELPKISSSKVRGVLEKFRSHQQEAPVENAENQKFMRNLKAQATLSRMKHVDDGTLIKSSELWKRLGVSRQAGSKAINEFRIFSIDGPGGVNLCPAFFADPEYDRATLEVVSKELGAIPGPSKWQFFTTPKVSLKGKTPLEAIKSGQINEVISAAVGFKER